jgi:hypothetical protein
MSAKQVRAWAPAFRAGVFLYANKSGARGVGGRGSARLVVTLDRATILNLYRIAHSESTVDKWDNSPRPNCERAADRGEDRQAARAFAPIALRERICPGWE